MKKLFPFAVIATVVTLSLTTACSKKSSDPTGNYTCICTETVAGTTIADTTTFPNVKKSQATAACNQNTSAGGATFTCKLQ